MRPSAGVSATFEKRYSKDIREVLEQVLLLSHHPRTLVQLVIQALSPTSSPHWKPSPYSSTTRIDSSRGTTANPSLIAASINASSLAFLNASSINMRGVLCAVAVGKVNVRDSIESTPARTDLILDPEESECVDGWGLFAFTFGATFDGGPNMKGCEPIWLQSHGLSNEQEHAKALILAHHGAEVVFEYIRRELASKAGIKQTSSDDINLV